MSTPTREDAIRTLCTEARYELQTRKACFCDDPANRSLGLLCWDHRLEQAIQILEDPAFRWEGVVKAKPVTVGGVE